MKTFHGIDASKYHGDPSLSKSGLDQFKRSPAHYRAWRDGDFDVEQTPAMAFGSAFHCAVLEEALFASRYRVFEGDRRTKQGKMDYEALEASGATIITKDMMNDIKAMQMAVIAHPSAHPILSNAKTEVSVFDTWDGVSVKARIDILPDDGDIIGDIKTTQDASPAGFAKSAASLRYHVQAAWYLRFFPNKRRFIFIAVEKTAPYEVGVYELDQMAIDAGNAEIDRQLELFRSCQEFNSWPGYSSQIQTLTLPNWAFKTEAL